MEHILQLWPEGSQDLLGQLSKTVGHGINVLILKYLYDSFLKIIGFVL